MDTAACPPRGTIRTALRCGRSPGPSVSLPARVPFEQQDHPLGSALPVQWRRAHLVAQPAAAAVDAVEGQLLAAVAFHQASTERLAQLCDRQPDVELEERPTYRLFAAQPPEVFGLLVPQLDVQVSIHDHDRRAQAGQDGAQVTVRLLEVDGALLQAAVQGAQLLV